MLKKYDKEFKLEALRLASEEGNSAARTERDLGIGRGCISRWKRQLANDGLQAFPGKGHLKADDEQLRRLKREVTSSPEKWT